MRAMVLAAGLGTRLRPLTDKCPKALVSVGGKTLLEITLARLRDFGISDVVINVHHFGELICEYLASNDSFGMRIQISQEDDLLDTGGGLKKVSSFFLDAPAEPFILHNVDVISTIDFAEMLRFHSEKRATATLATQQRKTSRPLLFDQHRQLCGRRIAGREAELARPSNDSESLGFCGVHVIDPRLLGAITETGSFSIIDAYLRLVAVGERIVSFPADNYYWRDLGTPESIAAAERELASNSHT